MCFAPAFYKRKNKTVSHYLADFQKKKQTASAIYYPIAKYACTYTQQYQTIQKMHPKFSATTGTVLEIMFENTFRFYSYVLCGTDRCAEICVCFSVVFFH